MEKDGEGAFSQSFRPIIYLFLGNSHNTAYNYRCTMLTKSPFVPSTILCKVIQSFLEVIRPIDLNLKVNARSKIGSL